MALMGITAINTLPQQSTDKLISSERFFCFVAPASDLTDTHTLGLKDNLFANVRDGNWCTTLPGTSVGSSQNTETVTHFHSHTLPV